METRTRTPAEGRAPRVARSIGPVGRIARSVVGLGLIGLALFWRDPDWLDVVLGLMVAPALVVAAMGWRARRSSGPLRAIGPMGHAVNLVVAIPLFALPATAGAAFLFYGASMLLAAARGNGGCEVTAVSNAVLHRDDQVGCALFAPVDLAEEARDSQKRVSAPSPSE